MPTKTLPRSAAPFVPPHPTLPRLREAAKACRGCNLYRYATQTVFGEGPGHARVVMLGEQPGNSEDLEGRPFIGPAGKMLDRALEEIGLDRQDVYISNVVKHFKYREKGKIRFHQKPTGIEIRACRPWLEAEMNLIKPDVTVCLGASAASDMLGRKVTLKSARGLLQPSPLGGQLLLTVHPAFILRQPDDDSRHAGYRQFVTDLRQIKRALVRTTA